MEELYQLSVALTTWLQETYPQLRGLMTLISALGEEPFYLVFLPAIYWSINKRLGRQLGYFFLFSGLINNVLKNIFRGPRPFWLDPNIKLGEAEGYGLPSGHVQHATVIFILLAAWMRRAWVWLGVSLYIVLMGLSRFYLGVHFPSDILGGFLIGLTILGVLLAWNSLFAGRYNRQILGRRILVIVLVPLVIAAIYIGAILVIGPPDTDVSWATYISAAETSGHEDIVATVAGLLGFGIGILLESSRIRFRVDGPIWQRVARYLFGVAVAVGIWAGLRAIFPVEPPLIALPLRFIRYLLLVIWITYFAPWVFVRLRLAQADQEPEIRVKL